MKRPNRKLASIRLAVGAILGLPPLAAQALRASFLERYGRLVGKDAARERIVRRIFMLDDHEKAVLREFYLKNRPTLYMSSKDPAVLSLRNAGLLRLVSSDPLMTFYGPAFRLKITEMADAILRDCPSAIDFPDEPGTEANAEWLASHRPRFAIAIEGWLMFIRHPGAPSAIYYFDEQRHRGVDFLRRLR